MERTKNQGGKPMKKFVIESLVVIMVATVAITNMIAVVDNNRTTKPDYDFEVFDTEVVELLEKVREA